MNFKSFLPIFFLFLGITLPLMPMAQKSPGLVLQEGSIEQYMNLAKGAKPGDTLYVESPYVSDWKLVGLLGRKKTEGVNIEIKTQKNWCNTKVLAWFAKKDIQVSVPERKIHTKRIILQRSNGTCVTVFGSRNCSSNGGNLEATTKLTPKRSKIHLKNFLAGSPTKKTIPKNSPTKANVFSTRVNGPLTSFLAQRIRNVNRSDQKETIKLATMTFNNEKITQAICEISPTNNVELVVDNCVLRTKKGLEQLNNISKAGANVFVYDPYRQSKENHRFHPIMHKKLGVRKIGDKYLSWIGSYNLTTHADKDDNILHFETTKDSYEAICKQFDDLKGNKFVMSFDAIDFEKVKNQRKSKSRRKRKLDFDSGGTLKKKNK